MGKDGYDLTSLAFELSSKIANGIFINLATVSVATNSTSYSRVGSGIIDMSKYRKSKITFIEFIAASGIMGSDGMDVQLYDFTNAAEIGVISFLGTEDNSIKSVDVNTYLQTISGKIEAEVNIRKGGPIGPANFHTAGIFFEGVI